MKRQLIIGILLFIMWLWMPGTAAAADNKIALTFDADMTYGMMNRVNSGKVATYFNQSLADYIVAHQLPVTIFTTGLFAKEYPTQLKQLAHYDFVEIENHSYDHRGFTPKCYGLGYVPNAADKTAEITKAQTIIQQVTGRTPKYFRFPGGCHSSGDESLVQAAGLTDMEWSLVGGDAFQKNPQVIIRRVSKAVGNQVVVMHFGTLNAPATAKALPVIVENLKKHNYTFVKLEDFNK